MIVRGGRDAGGEWGEMLEEVGREAGKVHLKQSGQGRPGLEGQCMLHSGKSSIIEMSLLPQIFGKFKAFSTTTSKTF